MNIYGWIESGLGRSSPVFGLSQFSVMLQQRGIFIFLKIQTKIFKILT